MTAAQRPDHFFHHFPVQEQEFPFCHFPSPLLLFLRLLHATGAFTPRGVGADQEALFTLTSPPAKANLYGLYFTLNRAASLCKQSCVSMTRCVMLTQLKQSSMLALRRMISCYCFDKRCESYQEVLPQVSHSEHSCVSSSRRRIAGNGRNATAPLCAPGRACPSYVFQQLRFLLAARSKPLELGKGAPERTDARRPPQQLTSDTPPGAPAWGRRTAALGCFPLAPPTFGAASHFFESITQIV